MNKQLQPSTCYFQTARTNNHVCVREKMGNLRNSQKNVESVVSVFVHPHRHGKFPLIVVIVKCDQESCVDGVKLRHY